MATIGDFRSFRHTGDLDDVAVGRENEIVYTSYWLLSISMTLNDLEQL